MYKNDPKTQKILNDIFSDSYPNLTIDETPQINAKECEKIENQIRTAPGA